MNWHWLHQFNPHRLRAIIHMVRDSASSQSGPIILHYPRASWYADNAGAMMRVLVKTNRKLEKALDLSLPPTDCYVVEPKNAWIIEEAAGAAHRNLIILGVAARHLSDLAGIGAHELAHILSYSLGRAAPTFNAEGFACYGASLIHAQSMPMGIPLHHHLAWLLTVGIKPRLEELWRRHDPSPELYDLAWSFAVFLAAHFGQKKYYRFYASRIPNLDRRVAAELEVTPARLEADWWAAARAAVPGDPRRISRLHRADGCVCSRAAWLSRRTAAHPA